MDFFVQKLYNDPWGMSKRHKKTKTVLLKITYKSGYKFKK